MPELISRPNVRIHGLDVSEHVRSITVDQTSSEIDTTSASSRARTYAGGLNDGTVVIDWLGVIGDEDRLAIGQEGRMNIIADADDPVSATNPEYRLRVKPYNTPSPTGRLGELSTEQTTFRLAGYSVHSMPELILHTQTQIGHWQATDRAPWWVVGAFEMAHTFSDRNRDPEHAFSAGDVGAQLLLPSFDESRHVLFFGAPTDEGGTTTPTSVSFQYDTGSDTVHPLTSVGDEYVLLALAAGIAYEDEVSLWRAGGTYDTARAPQTAELTFA